MQTSDTGLELIKKWEGFRSSAYKDVAGIWTIGYGTTRYPGGTSVRPGDTVSESEALGYKRHDLKRFEQAVNDAVTVELNQNEFDALVSLCYNIGVTAFSESTLVRVLNEGDHVKAAEQFLRWNKATIKGKKQVVEGLTNRRTDERALFKTPMETKLSPVRLKYRAKRTTFLKKEPSGEVDFSQPHKKIEADEIIDIESVIGTFHLHEQYNLAWGQGPWWLFMPDWEIVNDQETEVTAVFRFPAKRSGGLLYGDLKFSRGHQKLLEVRATSGQAGFQHPDAFKTVGRGLLPPGDWQIRTDGYRLPNPGIDGYFFSMAPDPHPAGRSQIGIHDDANRDRFPGSAGCIVTGTESEFYKVRDLLLYLRESQKTVPLLVVYI